MPPSPPRTDDLREAHKWLAIAEHDLVELQVKREVIEPSFANCFAAAQSLNPYSTEYRYPNGELAPPLAEAEDAVRLAGEIVRFVRQQL